MMPEVNRVVLADGTTLMDITDTTAESGTVAVGHVFYNAAGVRSTGVMIPGDDKLDQGAAYAKYNPGTSYVEGNVCTYDGKVYRCTGTTSGTWDSTKWEETRIGTLTESFVTGKIGAANGIAGLDANGKVPTAQLPSYVDDVINGYLHNGKFYKENTYQTEITPESDKIYIDLATNKTYRWGGEAYVEISASLALGETSSTAYRGDRGKTAYDHATDANRLTTAQTEGFYKVSTTAEGHVKSVSAVQKSDITALGIADNIIENLRCEDIPNTTQTITFDSSGNVSQITHTSGAATVRTDAFTFGTGTITEVRTLSTGQSMTIQTNTSTLVTTITYSAA